jgi:hypothetical protein
MASVLRAFALNPTTDRRRPATFPPPECEVCRGYEYADEGGVFGALLMFLEEAGVVRSFKTAAELQFPAEWEGLPDWTSCEMIALTGPEAAAAVAQLRGYELDEPAFLDYWLRYLYGGWYERPAPAEDVAAAGVAPVHLCYLRRVLAAGHEAEWLLVYDMPAEPGAAADRPRDRRCSES